MSDQIRESRLYLTKIKTEKIKLFVKNGQKIIFSIKNFLLQAHLSKIK